MNMGLLSNSSPSRSRLVFFRKTCDCEKVDAEVERVAVVYIPNSQEGRLARYIPPRIDIIIGITLVFVLG